MSFLQADGCRCGAGLYQPCICGDEPEDEPRDYFEDLTEGPVWPSDDTETQDLQGEQR